MSEGLRFILKSIGVILIGTWLASVNDFFAIIWGILVLGFVIWMVSGGGDGDVGGPGSDDY
jgi:hypothetical protein